MRMIRRTIFFAMAVVALTTQAIGVETAPRAAKPGDVAAQSASAASYQPDFRRCVHTVFLSAL